MTVYVRCIEKLKNWAIAGRGREVIAWNPDLNKLLDVSNMSFNLTI